MIEAGDQVVAVLRLSERTNELEIGQLRSSLLTLREGRIVRIEPLASKDQALEAAGLGEYGARGGRFRVLTGAHHA